MADVETSVVWTGTGLVFEAGSAGRSVVLDGDGAAGPTPVQTMLLSLTTCTAADVVAILDRMRVPFEGVALHAEGDRAAEPPRRYLRIRLRYVVRGVAEEDREKLERAVQLSHERYCSVLHSLAADIEVTSAVHLE